MLSPMMNQNTQAAPTEIYQRKIYNNRHSRIARIVLFRLQEMPIHEGYQETLEGNQAMRKHLRQVLDTAVAEKYTQRGTISRLIVPVDEVPKQRTKSPLRYLAQLGLNSQ
jgi:hypothetical protein